MAERIRHSEVPTEGNEAPPLSTRESQIMGLAASGLLDKQIGQELGISENTLRTYWRRIRDKVGEGSRASLVASYVLRERGTFAVIEVPERDNAGARSAFYYATELKRSQEAERRAKRALKVLRSYFSETANLSLERELLDAACRILVESGGYEMAWIGVPVYDAEKSIKPVASYGDRTGYLGAIKVGWRDDAYGRGSAGRAMRTGKTCINRDFLFDPTMAPWRDRARDAGFQASIGLPLVHRGTTLGVLLAYAPEADAFDAQESELLEEVATHLSRRIGGLRDSPLVGGQPATWELDYRRRTMRYFDPSHCAYMGIELGAEIDLDSVIEMHQVYSRDVLHTLIELMDSGPFPSFAFKARLSSATGLGYSTAYVDIVRGSDGKVVLLRGRRIPIFDLEQNPFGGLVGGRFSYDLDTGEVRIDDSCREIFRIDASEPDVRAKVEARFHPADFPAFRQFVRQMAENGVERMVRSYRIQAQSGDYHLVTIAKTIEYDSARAIRAEFTVVVFA